MKKEKSGISLIVLVVTIVVITILSAAIILSVTNTNIIQNSKKAAFQNDIANFKEELAQYKHNKTADAGDYDMYTLSADKDNLYEMGKKVEGNIQTVIPSINGEYLENIKIISGEIDYTSYKNMKQYAWAREVFEGISDSEYENGNVQDTNDVIIDDTKENQLEELKIYGNTIDDKSVGDHPKNLFDESKFSSKIERTEKGELIIKDYGFNVGRFEKFCPEVKEGDKVVFSMKTNGVQSALLKKGDFEKYLSVKNAVIEVTNEILTSDLYLYNTKAGGDAAIISNIQVEYGNKSTAYEPYDGNNLNKYKIPITITQNLFDIKKVSGFIRFDYKTRIDAYGKIESGIITSNIGVYGNAAYLYDSKINLTPGKYTISADFMSDKDSGNKGISIGMYNLTSSKYNTKHYTLSNYRTWENKSYTFNVDSNSEVIILVQGTGQKGDYTSLNMKIKNIKLEKNDDKTEYEEDVTQNIWLDEPLRKIDDVADYIDFKNKKIVRYITYDAAKKVYKKLSAPIIKDIDLSNLNLVLKKGTNRISIGTNIAPSNIEVIYDTQK
mgnify:FL=1